MQNGMMLLGTKICYLYLSKQINQLAQILSDLFEYFRHEAALLDSGAAAAARAASPCLSNKNASLPPAVYICVRARRAHTHIYCWSVFMPCRLGSKRASRPKKKKLLHAQHTKVDFLFTLYI
jgi:hypothetical protein